jgi:hypothetical protein
VDDRLTVIVLTNLAQMDPQYVAHGVAGFYVPELALPKHTRITIDPKLLELYAGKYEFAPGLILEIAPGDNKLLLKQGERTREFLPEANDTFYREDAETVLRFETDGAGMVTDMILDIGGEPQKIKRIP